MIKVQIFDDDDTLHILKYIHQMSLMLIKNNMDLKMCHTHNDECRTCDIKDFCYECEEIEVWSNNQCVKIETEINSV